MNEVNFDKPENARSKILFENLTPLHANNRLRMERGNGSTEDLTARVPTWLHLLVVTTWFNRCPTKSG